MTPPAPSPDVPDNDAAHELRARLDFDDARLLAECDIHLHRAGGPGGQHRNKVSSAVRLVHRPTGFTVTASERRSQHENRANALHRLREAIAIGVRSTVPVQVVWPDSVNIRNGQLKVGAQNPALCHVLALALDALAAYGGQVGKAAAHLGVTTSSLTRFLADHPKAWVEANRIRQHAGLAPLRA
ncbi:MAG: peptide chain release factor-like protein [Phycisphaerae bacterium]|nr:peptide chain release factor-like protein [Phycisphaerae bacterium]